MTVAKRGSAAQRHMDFGGEKAVEMSLTCFFYCLVEEDAGDAGPPGGAVDGVVVGTILKLVLKLLAGS